MCGARTTRPGSVHGLHRRRHGGSASTQAAEALKPIAGAFTFTVFAVGMQLLRHRDAGKDATRAYLRLATPKFREGRRRIRRGGNTEFGTIVQQ
jgi:hypothetical protein